MARSDVTLRLVVFGDGAWASRSMRRLAQEGHTIVAVVARARPTDGSVADAACELKASLLRPTDPHGAEFATQIAALAPDLILSVAYDRILRQSVLRIPRLGAVNFHAGKLPRYRGRNVVNWAIINGESEIGLTAHRMDTGIDTGDILTQCMLPIAWTDTYGDVLRRVVDAMPDVVAATVRGLAAGTLTPRPQPAGEGTYFGGRREGDEWLDWSNTSRDLYNKVRGITRPGPGARTLLDGRPVTVWRAHYEPTWPTYHATPGEVIGRREDGVVVKTGDSTLLVQEVEESGAAPAAPRWPLGTRLGLNPAAVVQTLVAKVAALEDEVARWRKP